MDEAPRKPRRKDRVLMVVKRGEYIRAQFEIDGEAVIGEYKLIGWARPPKAERAEFERILNSPPLVSYSTPGVRSARARRRAIDPKHEVDMPSILTPKRRRLTRSASKAIKAMAETWRRRTGAWSSNEMMGLSIRTGMLHQELVRLAIERDAIPRGVVQVPRLPPTPPGTGGLSVAGGMSGFSVDVEDLRQGPPDLRGKKR